MRIETRLAIMTVRRGGGGGSVSRSCSWPTGRSARCVLPAPDAVRALLGGAVPESAVAFSAGERRSVACLLAAERARHRVAVHLDGQEVREEARRPRRLCLATIDVKSTELVLCPGTIVVSTPLTRLVSLDKLGAVYDSVIAVVPPRVVGSTTAAPSRGGERPRLAHVHESRLWCARTVRVCRAVSWECEDQTMC